MLKREFTVADEYQYNRANPTRWIVSHLARYKWSVLLYVALMLSTNLLYASLQLFIGNAFNIVLAGIHAYQPLLTIALTMLLIIMSAGAIDIGARLLVEVIGKRFVRDAREELYVSLLGKSQTFHNRQRVGDIMARATNDMEQISNMVVPGFDTICDSMSSLVMPIIFIGILNPQLLAAPLLFVVLFAFTLRSYSRQLAPVSDEMRGEFGAMNAVLTEAVTGVEVVKATGQEAQELGKFDAKAMRYRDLYIKNGLIQGRYLPILMIAIIIAIAFLHGLVLVLLHQMTIGSLVAYMGLMSILRFPASISTWTFSLVQLGVAGSERVLALLKEETELDENESGKRAEIRGEIAFEHVNFSYGDTLVLKDVSFHAEPGQTIAIVGQTGSGKSTLTKLVNRIYDVDSGHVLVDGVDVREWNLDALRSQVSTIEQDIFLFSRSVEENIAYGLGQKATHEAIEDAARDAQAHDFIMGFKEGYNTMIGERGVTLSGGQRQRIAIARALLTDPRILILDDSTSAVDSATEDEIQKAIRRLLQGRTTLLITHRLSQIRWADKILVLKRGELIDQGTHDELMARSDTYRRIFAQHKKTTVTVDADETENDIHAINNLDETSVSIASGE